MTCPWCGSSRVYGTDELATCAACAKFVYIDRNAIERIFDRAREDMTPAERVQEAATRRRLEAGR